MNQAQTFKIRFENISVAEANKKASELRNRILDLTPDVSAEIVKDDPSTQDFGTTLVILLGTPAVIAIAKGIANYLSKTNTTIVIEGSDGTVIAKGITSNDAARIAEAFSQKK